MKNMSKKPSLRRNRVKAEHDFVKEIDALTMRHFKRLKKCRKE